MLLEKNKQNLWPHKMHMRKQETCGVRLDDSTCEDTVFVPVLRQEAALVHCRLYKQPRDDVIKKILVCLHSYGW